MQGLPQRQPLQRQPLQQGPPQRQPLQQGPLQQGPLQRQPLQRQPLQRQPLQQGPLQQGLPQRQPLPYPPTPEANWPFLTEDCSSSTLFAGAEQQVHQQLKTKARGEMEGRRAHGPELRQGDHR